MDKIAEHLKVGEVAKQAHQSARQIIKPGVSAMEIEKVIRQTIEAAGMKPAFLGYKGYPAASCISVNEQIVHGIPSKSILEEGDIVAVDLGVEHNGLIVDTARTYPVGNISGELKRLLKVTETALREGVKQAIPGNRTGDIGSKIHQVVSSGGFAIVRDLTGHGVGKTLQEPPSIPNFGSPKQGDLLKIGMTLAIEPITTLKNGSIAILDDGWTIISRDHSPSAHFEDTVIVTEDGPIVLT